MNGTILPSKHVLQNETYIFRIKYRIWQPPSMVRIFSFLKLFVYVKYPYSEQELTLCMWLGVISDFVPERGTEFKENLCSHISFIYIPCAHSASVPN
jgi:hypothetical protein